MCTSLHREGKLIHWNDRQLLHLSSNDYLGIGSNLILQREFLHGILTPTDSSGGYLGSGGSRLLCGDLPAIQKAEEAWRRWVEKEQALLFPTGYQANVALFSILGELGVTVFLDEQCHASMWDGLRVGGTRFFRFRHNDIDHLASILSRYGKGCAQPVIATEGVFSMEGDSPPLSELCALKEDYDAFLIVDEAHALGVLGSEGKGASYEAGMLSHIDVVIGTGGKALGASGGVIAGPKWLIEAIVNRGRPFIFTTGIPPLLAEWHAWIIPRIQKMEQERAHVRHLTSLLMRELQSLCLPVRGGRGCIVSVVAGADRTAVEWAYGLREAGFFVHPIRPPTVPEGDARIRISVTAEMTTEDVRALAETCVQVMARGKRRSV
ncbi:aminotransferase class I/II-fold pyridoxal phosphate-dependent enzyme [Spirochaeta thermophila]|nr:8-amino-7-oxononanoate synthase [Spirochaeta thermophila]